MRHIDTVKKAVVFTDIKDFTLKNSLLTQKQIRDFLNTQDDIVIPIVEKHKGKLVKTIGDSYMIVFLTIEDALRGIIEIQKTLEKYNKSINYNLHKLELRITVNYGDLQKEETIIGEDYFGDVINIASRLQVYVGANEIYTTKEVIDEIKGNTEFDYRYLGKASLRGILREIETYEIVYNVTTNKNTSGNPNNKYLLSQEMKEKIREINNTIIEFSLITAIAGMVDIPFIGGFIMLPFHLFLLKKIANKYLISYLTKKEIKTIIMATLMSLIGTTMIILLVKFIKTTSLVGYEGYFSFIMYFILSFCIGTFLNEYFWRESQKVENTNRDLKSMLKN